MRKTWTVLSIVGMTLFFLILTNLVYILKDPHFSTAFAAFIFGMLSGRAKYGATVGFFCGLLVPHVLINIFENIVRQITLENVWKLVTTVSPFVFIGVFSGAIGGAIWRTTKPKKRVKFVKYPRLWQGASRR